MVVNKLSLDKFLKDKITGIIIIIASLILGYLLISLYFTNHFFFQTHINGVNLSLRAYEDADNLIRDNMEGYELQLIERYGETEFITGKEIGLQYNESNSFTKIYKDQKSLQWISSVIMDQSYYLEDLYTYRNDKLEKTINDLLCMNRDILDPKNVCYQYVDGAYKVIAEVYGNKIIKNKLREEIKKYIMSGETRLDLSETSCYDNPMYLVSSGKTSVTMNLLNKYIATRVTYRFGKQSERLDGTIINKWLEVDKNLDVLINKTSVMRYVNELSKKYDTVGIIRKFNTSTGKTVEVKAGLYGWKIYQEGETKALLDIIKHGEVIEKEPIYTQKALSRDGNEIGNTYVEINISKQHLWFYKNGKLIAQGAVVTGNPNRGNATVVGAYMLNYKQDGATLKGIGYEVDVNYWMPFFGNMGIHDAKWRTSFGGEIYKRRGTHGCVNAPYYLAKTIYENIESGIPIIIYEE
ncbi:MAG: hypothetical protein K0R46_2249 [Herbinix sp.]|jgi:hypothetical protein|nr:hypothetical protein [Herbinix sp.]